MGISFDNIPTTIRVPIVAVEFNSSRAQQGPAILPYKEIIIGQKLASGTWAANSLNRATNVDQVITGGGRGSMLHRQAIAHFANNKQTEVWFGVLDDNGAGVAATGTIVVAGPATGDGTIVLYLGGERIPVGVTSGQTATQIGDAIAAAITAAPDLPITAANVAGTVTLTFRHKGLAGNAYDVRHSFEPLTEKLPAGVSLTITALGGVIAGTLNPVLTTLIANMADLWFQLWCHPYTDATSLTAIENELASRFGPLRSIDGVAITAAVGSHSALVSLGNGRNSPHSAIFASPGASPLVPPMELAAEIAAQVAIAAAADPARPFQTLQLARAIAPAETDQFSLEERNLLLYDGIATTVRVQGGRIQINRAITTYQTSASGAADTAYLDVTTLLTLLYLRYDWRNRLQTRYPRHKLAGDDVLARIGSGQAIITPKLGRGEALMWFRDMERRGLVEGFDQFKADLVVERNASDPNRLDFMLPPDLMNQLIVAAAQIRFQL